VSDRGCRLARGVARVSRTPYPENNSRVPLTVTLEPIDLSLVEILTPPSGSGLGILSLDNLLITDALKALLA